MINELKTNQFLINRNLPIMVLRRDPQEIYPLHSHEFFELVVVYRGEGMHLIHCESREIRAGDVFVVHGNTLHGYAELRDLALYNIIFDPAHSESYLSYFPDMRCLSGLEPGKKSNRVMHLNENELNSIIPMINEIETEQINGRDDSASIIIAWFSLIVAYISRFSANINNKVEVCPDRIAKLINEINQYPCKKWSRTILAKRAAMSVSTLTRVFKRAAGVAPHEYIMLARLRRAATLLLNIELSITSVAELSGFSDSNYFCRIFRKNFGSSPKQYRDRR
jgi:AraC-like DNA-binding protein